MDSVLVTGGAGFIGGCFVRQAMAETSDAIIVLDKLTYAGSLENLAELRGDSRFSFQQGDIADLTSVRGLLESHRPKWVINFAAESHVDRSIDEPSAFVQTNVVGVFQLLEACLSYWRGLSGSEADDFRLLHVSTDEVFGALGEEGSFDEFSPYAPNSPYAASKAAADHFVRAYVHTYGLPAIVTHSTNNYGPYQFPEKLIPLMVRRAVGGQSLPVYGDGSQVRDWLHVADHCRGLRLALTRGQPGRSYLFGGNCERSNIDVVRAICRIVDGLRPRPDQESHGSQISFVADRPGHDFRYSVDATAARRELGWRPDYDFETGLEETVRWYLEHGPWVERVTEATYDGGRLGKGRG